MGQRWGLLRANLWTWMECARRLADYARSWDRRAYTSTGGTLAVKNGLIPVPHLMMLLPSTKLSIILLLWISAIRIHLSSLLKTRSEYSLASVIATNTFLNFLCYGDRESLLRRIFHPTLSISIETFLMRTGWLLGANWHRLLPSDLRISTKKIGFPWHRLSVDRTESERITSSYPKIVLHASPLFLC